MFCCTLIYVHSSFAISLMRKKELVALLGFSSWCLVIVVWLFLAVPWICLHFFEIVAFPDHIHLQTEKATQAEKNPYSVFAEKDGEEVMDDESVVFTEPSSSDHLPKGTLSRLPLT